MVSASNLSATGESTNRFEAINILRAIAAFLVVLYHVIVIGKWTDYPVQGHLLLGRAGWIGVDLFLVISGFVIGLSAIHSINLKGSDFRWGFAKRRIFRIAPLYLLTATIFLFLVEPSLITQPISILLFHISTHLGFVHNLFPNTHGSINGPNWSVALEMQFYLLVMVAGPWIVRGRPWMVVFGCILTALLWRAAVVETIGLGIDRAHLLHVYTSQLPGVMDAFGMGITLAILVSKSERPWILRPSWVSTLLWLGIFCLFYWVTFAIYWPRAGYWDQWPMVVLWRTLLSLTAVSLLAVAVTIPTPGGLLRALSPLGYLGEISYGIYLWHLPVLLTLISVPGLVGLRLFLWVSAGTVVLAACSWHLMERPLLERARRPV